MGRKRGRPTKLTPETQETILNAIRAGNYIETAAALAGISKETFYKWLRRGARAKTGKHRDFVDAVEKAQAEAEALDLQIIRQASKKHWQAAAWRLERRSPERWGRQRLEITGADGGPLEMETGLTIEVVDARDAGDGPGGEDDLSGSRGPGGDLPE